MPAPQTREYRPAHLHTITLTTEQRATLMLVMADYGKATCLTERDRDFLDGQANRYRQYGIHLALTQKQWAWFEAIHRKMFPQERAR